VGVNATLYTQAQDSNQGSDTRQEKTRQIDEARREVLPTSTHLWLLTVRRSDTWRTVVPKKATKCVEIKIVHWWLCIIHPFNL